MSQDTNPPGTEIYAFSHRSDCSLQPTVMAILATGNHVPSTFTHVPLSYIPEDEEVLIFAIHCLLFTDLSHLL